MTQFCGAHVELWDDLRLFVDGNSKITRENGTYENPTPNAFSLPHISTCPGSTEICRKDCYVHGLEKHAPALYAEYRNNERVLHSIMLSTNRVRRSAEIFGDWITMNARKGFRWHVSGDVIHERHARWIVEVCRSASRVPFWIYTKTFEVVPVLLEAQNLTVNLSADRQNLYTARQTWSAFAIDARGRLRFTFMSDDGSVPEDFVDMFDVIFPDYPQRGRDLADPTTHPFWQSLDISARRKVCPADFFGQSHANRCGPCRKCL